MANLKIADATKELRTSVESTLIYSKKKHFIRLFSGKVRQKEAPPWPPSPPPPVWPPLLTHHCKRHELQDASATSLLQAFHTLLHETMHKLRVRARHLGAQDGGNEKEQVGCGKGNGSHKFSGLKLHNPLESKTSHTTYYTIQHRSS